MMTRSFILLFLCASGSCDNTDFVQKGLSSGASDPNDEATSKFEAFKEEVSQLMASVDNHVSQVENDTQAVISQAASSCPVTCEASVSEAVCVGCTSCTSSGYSWDGASCVKLPTWILGKPGHTCTGTCQGIGGGCGVSKMNEVREGTDIKAAFAKAGYSCATDEVGARPYPGAPFATGRTPQNGKPDKDGKVIDCYGLPSGRIATCESNGHDLHQSLCYCETTTTTTCAAGSTCRARCLYNEVNRRRRVAEMCSCRRRSGSDNLPAGWLCQDNKIVGNQISADPNPAPNPAPPPTSDDEDEGDDDSSAPMSHDSVSEDDDNDEDDDTF